MIVSIYNINGQVVYFLNEVKMTLIQLLQVLGEQDHTAYSIFLTRLEILLKDGLEKGDAWEGELATFGRWTKL